MQKNNRKIDIKNSSQLIPEHMGNLNYGFLTGKEISSIIQNNDGIERDASLDFKIECFIKNGKVIRKTKITIKPQEMFIVVLKGQVTLPKNCIGIAFPKTSLCEEGIHVLNTGIIDPGYKGYLSTVAINFSNQTRAITKDDVYIRLMIYRNRSNYGDNIKECDYETYLDKRIEESKEYPDTFLDVPRQVKDLSLKMANTISSNLTNRILIILTIGTMIFAAFSFWIGNSYINKMQEKLLETQSQDSIEITLNEEYYKVLEKLDELERKIRVIENEKD